MGFFLNTVAGCSGLTIVFFFYLLFICHHNKSVQLALCAACTCTLPSLSARMLVRILENQIFACVLAGMLMPSFCRQIYVQLCSHQSTTTGRDKHEKCKEQTFYLHNIVTHPKKIIEQYCFYSHALLKYCNHGFEKDKSSFDINSGTFYH